MKKYIITESQYRALMEGVLDETPLDYETYTTGDTLEDLRNAIDSNKMVSVSFVKKDGTVKHMVIRKTLSSHVYSDREKTQAQMDVEMNNNIKRVIDMNSYNKNLRVLTMQNPEADPIRLRQEAAKFSWRTINLTSVLGFLAQGRFYDLRDENNIMDTYGEAIYNSLTPGMLRALENNPE